MSIVLPGLKGIELNEVVDGMTNDAYDIHLPFPRVSHAYARVLVTKHTMDEWRKIPACATLEPVPKTAPS